MRKRACRLGIDDLRIAYKGHCQSKSLIFYYIKYMHRSFFGYVSFVIFVVTKTKNEWLRARVCNNKIPNGLTLSFDMCHIIPLRNSHCN